MENKRNFYFGEYNNFDIDKIISIHQNMHDSDCEYFVYLEGISEKIEISEREYDELNSLLYNMHNDIEDIIDLSDDEDTSSNNSISNMRLF